MYNNLCLKNYKYDYNAESGVMHCIVMYPGSDDLDFAGFGFAYCHPDDEKYMSERTGAVIAEYRAEIDLLRKIKKFKLIPSVEALEHTLSTMKQSPRYTDNSYEAKRLKREIKNYKLDIKDITNLMEELESNLKLYIE